MSSGGSGSDRVDGEVGMSAYAYVCTLCHHLANRHHLKPDAASVVEGPYGCTEEGCDCEIDQRTPLSGIDEATCAARFYR